MTTLTRGQLAKASKVGAETIRYYEREKLLLPTHRSSNGYRRYGGESVQRLKFIRRAKSLGFDLKQIRELLSLHDDPNATRAEVKALTKRKLDEIDHRIEDLVRMQDVLDRLASECSGKGKISGCPIIQALATDGGADTHRSESK
jgi:Cu(I)-responsive transcriptional regulator